MRSGPAWDRTEAAERGAQRLVRAGFQFRLVAAGGLARLRHHRRIDQKSAPVDERSGGGRLAASRAQPAAFACRQAQIHPQVAAKRFTLAIVPGERSPQKREERLAKAGDRLGFCLPRETRSRGARQRALDARGDQQQRFALDGVEQLPLVFRFAGDAQAAVVERVAVQEPRRTFLLQHEPDHRTGGSPGAPGQGLSFIGGQHNLIYTREE